VGGQRLLEILTRITEGQGTLKDLDTIKEISYNMQASSLCALGQLTPGPVMAALRFFEKEFIQHIEDKVCEAGQCKALVRARCINACPAGVESPAYLALVTQGRYAEGLAIHREHNPFALVCGRVCPAFCEERCRRSELDQPIAIRTVKRFMADQEYQTPWAPEPIGTAEERQAAAQKKIAVVGAGPGGLTAALRLAQHGYQVTVFEKLPIPGGMMTVGIPEYRLPREPLLAEVANIQRAGVDIRYNQTLGKDFTVDSLLGQDKEQDKFHAVILAIGAHVSRKLGIPGEDKAGVVHGTDFLRDIGLAETSPLIPPLRGEGDSPSLVGKGLGVRSAVAGQRVAIVGGGDVAIDAARSAWRLGAKEVHVIYRRQLQDMPAHKEEIEAARNEGIQFHFLANPTKVLGDGHVSGVVVQRQRLAEFDDSGRRRPRPLEGEEFTLDVDVLVPAIGQTTDTSWLDGSKIELTRANTFAVNEAFMTSRPGVFACGDAVSGPWTVIGAVGQGNLVAVAVDTWLKTGKLEKPRYETPRHDIPLQHNLEDYAAAQRPEMPELSVAERQGSFCEVELGLDESTACEEAKRCLRCDLEWLDYMKIPRP
jgi:NADH-quinone oxidoreductase subunit F